MRPRFPSGRLALPGERHGGLWAGHVLYVALAVLLGLLAVLCNAGGRPA